MSTARHAKRSAKELGHDIENTTEHVGDVASDALDPDVDSTSTEHKAKRQAKDVGRNTGSKLEEVGEKVGDKMKDAADKIEKNISVVGEELNVDKDKGKDVSLGTSKDDTTDKNLETPILDADPSTGLKQLAHDIKDKAVEIGNAALAAGERGVELAKEKLHDLTDKHSSSSGGDVAMKEGDTLDKEKNPSGMTGTLHTALEKAEGVAFAAVEKGKDLVGQGMDLAQNAYIKAKEKMGESLDESEEVNVSGKKSGSHEAELEKDDSSLKGGHEKSTEIRLGDNEAGGKGKSNEKLNEKIDTKEKDALGGAGDKNLDTSASDKQGNLGTNEKVAQQDKPAQGKGRGRKKQGAAGAVC